MALCNIEFDNQFKEIENLRWKPWVGKNYQASIEYKLLVVGESHYCWKNKLESSEKIIAEINNIGFTRSIIHQYGACVKNNSKQPIFRNIEKTLFNKKKIMTSKQKEFWHSISFYNFIQRPLLSREKKHRPNAKDWSQGWNAFFKVIDIINPDIILFCGVEALSQEFAIQEELKESKYIFRKRVVKTKNKIGSTFVRTNGILENNTEKIISVICIDHPSSFFSWNKWHQIIKKQMVEYLKWLDI